MEQEVTPEMQAALNIKLAEDVRALVRSELKAALEDREFVGLLGIGNLVDYLTPHLTYNAAFRSAVLSAIQKQLAKL